ncbi:DUF7009 family protein [Robertkochia flava]|uniref:DUF7009 family protein n=1 Tax=Robertkochia flava TaxID=3447986 RepID=UPI001CCA6839|nr:hypothetical protein [Robertkochia marina]
MKLRIKENTLRFRLSQGEVTEFKEQGTVRSITSFNLSGAQQLIYVLQRCESCDLLQATFSQNMIVVNVPAATADEWTDTNLVGFNNEVDAKDPSDLFILVEKDFQCLHKRPNEDESDNFPNPLADLKT